MNTSALSRRLLCLGLAVAPLACDRSLTVEIAPESIQQRLDAKFPVQQPLLFGTVTFDNPKVVLREGSDRLGIELQVKLQVPLLPAANGSLSASGRPLYRADQKAFYLQGATIDRLDIVGLPPAEAEKLRGPAEIVARAVLDSFPVYELEQRNWKEATAEHTLKSVSVRNGKLLATLSL
jgi:hypothetical protein